MAVPNPIVVQMTVASDVVAFEMGVSADVVSFGMSVGAAIYTSEIGNYEGPYLYTPTQEEQTIFIGGERAVKNIIIEPIPSNYGLVTWNGSFLTIS